MLKINHGKYNGFKYITGSFYLWPGLLAVAAIGMVLCAHNFFIPDNEASAFTMKAVNQGLSPAEWNALPEDFVDKAGDTMGGNLSLGGNRALNIPAIPSADTDAVNRQWVEDEIASVFGAATGGEARSISGAHLRIYCASTPLTTTWSPYPSTSAGDYISTYVNTGAAGFAGPGIPYYFTALRGGGEPWRTTGPDAIVNATTADFMVVLRTALTAAQAEAFGWRIDWCGVGN